MIDEAAPSNRQQPRQLDRGQPIRGLRQQRHEHVLQQVLHQVLIATREAAQEPMQLASVGRHENRDRVRGTRFGRIGQPHDPST